VAAACGVEFALGRAIWRMWSRRELQIAYLERHARPGFVCASGCQMSMLFAWCFGTSRALLRLGSEMV
jgi:hypothetical protein